MPYQDSIVESDLHYFIANTSYYDFWCQSFVFNYVSMITLILFSIYFQTTGNESANVDLLTWGLIYVAKKKKNSAHPTNIWYHRRASLFDSCSQPFYFLFKFQVLTARLHSSCWKLGFNKRLLPVTTIYFIYLFYLFIYKYCQSLEGL